MMDGRNCVCNRSKVEMRLVNDPEDDPGVLGRQWLLFDKRGLSGNAPNRCRWCCRTSRMPSEVEVATIP